MIRSSDDPPPDRSVLLTKATTNDSYAALIQQLAKVTGRADAERAEAETWFERQCVSADRAVSEATEAVRLAEAEVVTAQDELQRTDAEVAHLWQTLRGRLGSASRRAADPPVPARGAVSSPAALLEGVRDLLERTRQRRELPSSAQPLLAMFGVLGAAAAYALGVAARVTGTQYGDDLAVGMPVLGLVVALLGPVVGLAPAKLLADRRHAGLDIRAIAVVLIAGVLTTGALFAGLR